MAAAAAPDVILVWQLLTAVPAAAAAELMEGRLA
jgi:hypothetical protein